jgi:hypothetical protein
MLTFLLQKLLSCFLQSIYVGSNIPHTIISPDLYKDVKLFVTLKEEHRLMILSRIIALRREVSVE